MKTDCRKKSPDKKMFNKKCTIYLENNNFQKSNQTDQSPLRVNKSLTE